MVYHYNKLVFALIIISKLPTCCANCVIFSEMVLLRPDVSIHMSNQSKLWVAYIHSDLFSVVRQTNRTFLNFILKLKNMMNIEDILKKHLSQAFILKSNSSQYLNFFHKVPFTPVGWYQYPGRIPTVNSGDLDGIKCVGHYEVRYFVSFNEYSCQFFEIKVSAIFSLNITTEAGHIQECYQDNCYTLNVIYCASHNGGTVSQSSQQPNCTQKAALCISTSTKKTPITTSKVHYYVSGNTVHCSFWVRKKYKKNLTFNVSYQVMDKISEIEYKNTYGGGHLYPAYFHGLSTVYSTQKMNIQHWLIRVELLQRIVLHMSITLLCVTCDISIYDGPGDKAYIMRINKHMKCTTHLCYVIVHSRFQQHLEHRTDILDYFPNKLEENKTIMIQSMSYSEEIIMLNLDFKNTGVTVYNIMTLPALHISVEIPNISHMAPDSITCMYGDVAVVESDEYSSSHVRLSVCHLEPEFVLTSNYTSSGNMVYITAYQYAGYGRVQININVTATECIGLFFDPLIYPHLYMRDTEKVNVHFKLLFQDRKRSVHAYISYDGNTCLSIQHYEIDWGLEDNLQVRLNLLDEPSDNYTFDFYLKLGKSFNKKYYSNNIVFKHHHSNLFLTRNDIEDIYPEMIKSEDNQTYVTEKYTAGDAHFRVIDLVIILAMIDIFILDTSHGPCFVPCQRTLSPINHLNEDEDGVCHMCDPLMTHQSILDHSRSYTDTIAIARKNTLRIWNERYCGRVKIEYTQIQYRMGYKVEAVWHTLSPINLYLKYDSIIGLQLPRLSHPTQKSKCLLTLRSRNIMRSSDMMELMYEDLWRARISLPISPFSSNVSTAYFSYSMHTTWQLDPKPSGRKDLWITKKRGGWLFKTWEEAKKHCQSLSGHLASIHSHLDLQIIQSIIPPTRFIPGVYIGLHNKVVY